MTKKRGRPRQYNVDTALDSAMELFWSKGFTATSLDELSAAMQMNRPSLYNAFGDKESIYRLAFARFVSQLKDSLEISLFKESDLKKAMKQFYSKALEAYFNAPQPLGCFVTCTAPGEAPTHPQIQHDLLHVIKDVDSALEKRLLQAQTTGDWSKGKDPKQVAKLLHATLQSMAVRTRAGESRAALVKMYNCTIDILC